MNQREVVDRIAELYRDDETRLNRKLSTRLAMSELDIVLGILPIDIPEEFQESLLTNASV